MKFQKQAERFTEKMETIWANLALEKVFELTKVLQLYQYAALSRKPYDPELHKQCMEEAGLVSADPNFLGYIIPAIQKSRNNDLTVLIEGESGTGKGMVADCIWKTGSRSREKMIKVNCGALNNELASSELFGHEKGAFTGAITDHEGFCKAANGGILFLDEISELSEANQVKLLRVIDDGAVQPLGSTKTVKVDVKIIAATNQNLEEKVKKGSFREDLFYRLQGMRINLLPLFLRPGDLPPLLVNSIKKFNKGTDKPFKFFGPFLIFELFYNTWPGNVRELDATVQQACIKNDPEHLWHLSLAYEKGPIPFVQQRNYSALILSFSDIEKLGKDVPHRISDLASESPYKILNKIDSLVPEQWQSARGYWKLMTRLDDYYEREFPTNTAENPSSLGSQEGQVALPLQGGEQQTGALQPDPQEDPYAPIYALTKSELLEKYARGIIARNPSTTDAAKAASVSRQTIRIWKEKYALSQQ